MDSVHNTAAPTALRLLRHRWTAAIVVQLSATAPIGYLALHRQLGIAQKVLTQHLRYLESAGAIIRHEDPISRRVRYELSPRGQRLAELVGPLCDWPNDHEANVAPINVASTIEESAMVSLSA